MSHPRDGSYIRAGKSLRCARERISQAGRGSKARELLGSPPTSRARGVSASSGAPAARAPSVGRRRPAECLRARCTPEVRTSRPRASSRLPATRLRGGTDLGRRAPVALGALWRCVISKGLNRLKRPPPGALSWVRDEPGNPPISMGLSPLLGEGRFAQGLLRTRRPGVPAAPRPPAAGLPPRASPPRRRPSGVVLLRAPGPRGGPRLARGARRGAPSRAKLVGLRPSRARRLEDFFLLTFSSESTPRPPPARGA